MHGANTMGTSKPDATITASHADGLTVQLAGPEHLGDLSANMIAMAKETEGLDLPMHRVRQGVQAALNQQHLGAYYVILNSSQVIAQVKVTYMWSGWRNANTWWIQSVYVRPAYRRQGCFRRLYHHVRAAAAGAGAAGLRLCVEDGIAHGMYTNLGMTSHYRMFEDMLLEK